MSSYPQWISRVVDDLSTFSSSLLEPGLAPAARGPLAATHLPTSMAASVGIVDLFARHVRMGLDEFDHQALDNEDLTSSRSPRGARPSRRPADYVIAGDRLLPRAWVRTDVASEIPVDLLRWLFGVAHRLNANLDLHGTRLGKQIELARIARAGNSIYADADAAALDDLQARLNGARHQLEAVASRLSARAGERLAPNSRRPQSWPVGAVWQRLRRIADSLEPTSAALAQWIAAIAADGAPVADIPYLYQRWCGLQILDSAARQGWRAEGDIAGALYLGGLVSMKSGDDLIELWIEPRLGRAQSARVGWQGKRDNELTPDFLFVTGAVGSRDAFVLDATMLASPQNLAKKATYRERLVGIDSRVVAGVTIPRRPLRAWAAAPLPVSECLVADPEGFGGTVPIHGDAQSFPALDAWLADIFMHASASRLRAGRL